MLLDKGFTIELYEARRTVSKYLTVKKDGRSFKVRFSNHAPINARELKGDCDFFVGVTNLGTYNTRNAYDATMAFFANHKIEEAAA